MSSHDRQREPQRDLVGLIRSVYLGGRSGLVEIDHPGGHRRLYFSGGELCLPPAHPLISIIEPHLAAAIASRSADGTVVWKRDRELAALMQRIAYAVLGWHDAECRFEEGREQLPEGMLGPLPTALLVIEQAAARGGEQELLASLGGESSRLRAVHTNPVTARAACLAEDDLRLLDRLAEPVPLAELLAGAGEGREHLLRRLRGLAAVGLVEALAGKAVSRRDVTGNIVRRLGERVAAGLARRPLGLAPDAHRAAIAELFARLGDLDHYQLLELPVGAPPEEIQGAFEKRARLVHPSHARALELEGREGVLQILFERAAEAYLTLSDPRRRGRYDWAMGLEPTAGPPLAEREEERRKLARRHFQQASALAESEDYHFALELVRQAVQDDPQPEYYALMGRIQAKNPHPNWQRQAADSLARALDGGTGDREVVLILAEVSERLGRGEKAVQLYSEVLEKMPGEPRAEQGLARLAAAEQEAARRPRGWLQRLLGRDGAP